jgi:hypothetical protein
VNHGKIRGHSAIITNTRGRRIFQSNRTRDGWAMIHTTILRIKPRTLNFLLWRKFQDKFIHEIVLARRIFRFTRPLAIGFNEGDRSKIVRRSSQASEPEIRQKGI